MQFITFLLQSMTVPDSAVTARRSSNHRVTFYRLFYYRITQGLLLSPACYPINAIEGLILVLI